MGFFHKRTGPAELRERRGHSPSLSSLSGALLTHFQLCNNCKFSLQIVTILMNNQCNASFKEIAHHNIDTLMELVDDLQSEKIVKSSEVTH